MKKLGIAAAILAGFVAMQGAHAEHHDGKGKAKAHKAKVHKGQKGQGKVKNKKATKAAPKEEPAAHAEDYGGEQPAITEEGDAGMGE